MTTNDQPKQNTDRELWRESNDRSQCTPSIHVTQDGGIGINVGGTVIVRPIREWHALAAGATNARRIANVADFMAEDDDDTPAPTTVPQPIIAKPEQPPFTPGQRVRTNDGRVLDVSRCEKRHVPGKLRWVVDDLNGKRAFADECELYEGVKPEVRYACTKLAAVGDTVKVIGSNPPLHMKVEEVSPTGGLYIKSPTGAWCMLLNSSQVEFVPEVTPAHPVCRGCNQPLKAENAWMSDGCPCNNPRGINHGLVPKEVCTCEECAKPDHIVDANKMIEPATDFDFDEAANKAATAILNSLAGTTGVSREWASDIISAQIRPGVQQLYAKLQHRRCDTCGANTIDGCMRCGAPQCCPQCCIIDDLRRRLEAVNIALGDRKKLIEEIEAVTYGREASPFYANMVLVKRIEALCGLRGDAVDQLTIAKLLLGQCGATFFIVGRLEIRLKDGGWKLFYPSNGLYLADRFDEPIAAYVRAKELNDAAKGGAS